MIVIFPACKHLDFDDHYIAEKQILSGRHHDTVFWLREVPDPSDPSMVQFCKKRGNMRMNAPDVCLCESSAQCGEFELEVRSVRVPNP